MNTVPVTTFRRNIFSLLDTAITYNEPLQVTTKTGNAVIVSADEWRDILATIEIMSNKHLSQKILEAHAEPLEECLSEEEVGW